MTDKATLRRQLLRTRKSLSVAQWQEKSDRICTHLQALPLLRQAKTVLGYLSARQEPGLEPLFAAVNCHWGLPRCVGSSLQWHLWQVGDPLESGAFGISEPTSTAAQISARAVDLILLPAVACDRNGYRLGYGGGFYDRLLSLPEWQAKPTIGIVFDFAYLPNLPIDPWDKKLDGICTESGFKAVSTSKFHENH